MGDPRHRRNGPLSGRTALALVLLLPSLGLAQSAVQALGKTVEKQIERYRKNLPDLDLSRFAIEALVQRALSGEATDTDALRNELTAAALKMNRAAKVAILTRIRAVAGEVAGSPTDPGTYAVRRELVLDFDFVERAFGKSPVYPPQLGQPYSVLVSVPAEKHFKLVDGFLGHLARIPIPEEPGATMGAPGTGANPDEPGSPGVGVGIGLTPDPPEVKDPGPVRPRDDGDAQVASGWGLVRIYVLGILGAIVLIYGSYLVYTTAKGGSTALSFFWQMIRPKRPVTGLVGDDEEPFRKGLKLFGKGRTEDALMIFEALIKAGGPPANPSRYYAILCCLKLGKAGLVKRMLAELTLTEFSLDELYRLGLGLAESEDRAGAVDIFKFLQTKDPSYKDVAQRLAQLQPKL